MDLQKILKIVAANIGVLSIGFLAWIISAGDDAIKAGESASSVSTYMYVAYFVLAVAVLSVVVFTVLNLIHNAAGLKNTLISIAAFILLALICYFVFASGVETILKDGSVLTVVQSKLVGAGLYLFYILALVAGLTMLFFSTTNQASLSEKVVNIVVKTIPALCVLIVFAFFGVGDDSPGVDLCRCATESQSSKWSIDNHKACEKKVNSFLGTKDWRAIRSADHPKVERKWNELKEKCLD